MQDISNTLWAYATLRHYPGAELLDGAARQAVSTIYRFKPQEVANTLWSYATLGHDPKNLLLDAMAAQMAQRILHFRPQVAAVSQVSAFVQVVPFRDSFCPLQRQVLSLSETVFVPFRDSFCPLQRQLLSPSETVFVPFRDSFEKACCCKALITYSLHSIPASYRVACSFTA